MNEQTQKAITIATWLGYEVVGHEIKHPIMPDINISVNEIVRSYDRIMEAVDKIEKCNGNAYVVSIHKDACFVVDTGRRGNINLNSTKTVIMVRDKSSRLEALVDAVCQFVDYENARNTQ